MLEEEAEVQMDLGALLKQTRKKAGIKEQGEMAEYLGVSRQTISSWETGVFVPMRGMVLAWSLLTGSKLSTLIDAWERAVERHRARAEREEVTLRRKYGVPFVTDSDSFACSVRPGVPEATHCEAREGCSQAELVELRPRADFARRGSSYGRSA